MAPSDNLAPPGSSSYSSNTMNVGDGTWDASRNDFLLPNLVGLNFETMRYNGMGNRFASMPQYHSIIKGHGIVAAITFLLIVPAAIIIARFYSRPGRALKLHIYLQVMTLGLSTVVFILGWFAVGPKRSLTNPHHGIGLAIYVLILIQAIGGSWIYSHEKGKNRVRLPLRLVLHQWMGRAIALLGIAQVPLGLTLYGSPKPLFILYTVWMVFLLVLYFILSFRSRGPIGGGMGHIRESVHGGTVIEDERPSRFGFGGLVAPIAAGAGLAALLGRNRKRSRSRNRRDEVVPSRRGSGSYIEEEKYEQRQKEGGGLMDKMLKGAAILGAGALAKSWYDSRQRKKKGDEYSSVAPDTPSRRNRRHEGSDVSEESRLEEGRHGAGPGGPAAAAAAIGAAEPRPVTPRPMRSHRRDDSYDSIDRSSYTSPSRRPQASGGVGKGLLAGLGLGWVANRFKSQSDRKEQERLEEERAERMDEERRHRMGNRPPRLTGDGHPSPRRDDRRRPRIQEPSDLSTVADDPHVRPGASIPPIPPALGGAALGAAAGLVAGAALAHSGSRHSVANQTAAMPPAPPDPQGVLHQDSGSEAYMSPTGGNNRRHSSRRRREGEAAAAAAFAGAAGLAAEERRRRDHSQGPSQAVASPPVSVKVRVDHNQDRNVTLRRLTEQEAAAGREARRAERRRRADSVSSLSGTDSGAQRYRRDTSQRRGESSSGPPPPPPAMEPLSPPNPAFAGGRRPKDSAYYSGRPGTAGTGSVGSPESHGTWSAMSPGGSTSGVNDERRRRRRLERNQRSVAGTVEFS